MVGQHADRLQLGVVEEVGFVDHDDGGAAAFDLFDGEGVDGLRDQGGVVGQRPRPERGDDLVVDAADPDGRVREVDDGVAVGSRAASAARTATVFPAPTSPVMTPIRCVFGDAPADPGDGLAVAGVAVQHAGGEVAAERQCG